ncbi:hypothetical protein O6H91_17G089700 [Diphasiastrum complanatum]|uniref:Uncharacterized protein n=1 Tax=Diphasiastrum complanatum TaxID=34168 RepID=A0ACC2B949_DIPCM|nr:hypothetical protein O6H91_17G089700 [Diphasiastrum complanatum]
MMKGSRSMIVLLAILFLIEHKPQGMQLLSSERILTSESITASTLSNGLQVAGSALYQSLPGREALSGTKGGVVSHVERDISLSGSSGTTIGAGSYQSGDQSGSSGSTGGSYQSGEATGSSSSAGGGNSGGQQQGSTETGFTSQQDNGALELTARLKLSAVGAIVMLMPLAISCLLLFAASP